MLIRITTLINETENAYFSSSSILDPLQLE